MRLCLLCVAIAALTTVGCSDQRERAFPEHMKIQVTAPDEPAGSRIALVTPDVQDGRDAFVRLYETAKRVGRSDPTRVRLEASAHEVLTITYRGPTKRDDLSLVILAREDGEWATTGYGLVETFDLPTGWPKYRYSGEALLEVRKWHERHVHSVGEVPDDSTASDD